MDQADVVHAVIHIYLWKGERASAADVACFYEGANGDPTRAREVICRAMRKGRLARYSMGGEETDASHPTYAVTKKGLRWLRGGRKGAE